MKQNMLKCELNLLYMDHTYLTRQLSKFKPLPIYGNYQLRPIMPITSAVKIICI